MRHGQSGRLRAKDGVATLSYLVHSSLQLRPDRIPIGEVRGPQALDLLNASGTGHPGAGLVRSMPAPRWAAVGRRPLSTAV